MANIVFITLFSYQYVVSMSVTWVMVIIVYKTDKSVYLCVSKFCLSTNWSHFYFWSVWYLDKFGMLKVHGCYEVFAVVAWACYRWQQHVCLVVLRLGVWILLHLPIGVFVVINGLHHWLVSQKVCGWRNFDHINVLLTGLM